MAKKKTTKKKKDADSEVPFEASLESLREILTDLENGNLPLEESLAKYESGIAHLRNCHVTLNAAKQKIDQLVRVKPDGETVTKPYAHSATMDADGSQEVTEADHDELQSELEEEQTEEEQTDEDDESWDGGLF
jgi:exodeoxyribonuclease VII small subunit